MNEAIDETLTMTLLVFTIGVALLTSLYYSFRD